MANIIKFPNGGYDVAVVTKEDILRTIDVNITDKEVAYAIIRQLEFDATKFIRDGKWTGIPNLGNIRIPKERQLLDKQLKDGLIQAAAENMTNKQFVVFRKNLSIENIRKARYERYYKYVSSIMVNRNKKVYKVLERTYGIDFAMLTMFFAYNMEYIKHEEELDIYGK